MSMMPLRTATASLMLLIILPTQLSAQTSLSLPEPDKDPFVGTWKANADKSRPKLNKVEASYARTISRDGDDRVISSRTKKGTQAPIIKGKDYSEFFEKNYKVRCDGLPHPVPSGVLSSITSCMYKSANRVEGETHTECPKGVLCQGELDAYWTEEVSSDGQVMTVSAYTDRTRTKLKSTEVMDRVK